MKAIREIVEKKGWTIRAYRPEEGTLTAKTPRTFRSWGEAVVIHVKSHDGGSHIGITSNPTDQAFDWGKSKDNVAELAAELGGNESVKALLASRQHQRNKRARWITFVLTPALVVGAYPFEREVVPLKEVLVVDEEQRPVAGASVHQWWQHSTVEHTSHDELRMTDTSGNVMFPRRTIRASFFFLCVGTVRNFVTGFVHSSYGAAEGVVVSFEGYNRDRDRSASPPELDNTRSEVLPPVLEDGIVKQKVIIRPYR
jgi:hypothetical protein